jgi:hypothetical protein
MSQKVLRTVLSADTSLDITHVYVTLWLELKNTHTYQSRCKVRMHTKECNANFPLDEETNCHKDI